MTTYPFNLAIVDPSWTDCLQQSLAFLDLQYQQELTHSPNWLPGPEKIFNAFSLPLTKVNYVLLGESPYPRRESANGYAFWDAAVKELWSPTGLSKQVNRATSLRNILKMLLIAEGCLSVNQPNQEEIAKINKQTYIQTSEELFSHLLTQGFLLLNATLVLQENGAPHRDARAWYPFMKQLLSCLIEKRPEVKFILLGRIANLIDPLLPPTTERIYAEHPYNLSFISNQQIINFFKPLRLLKK